VPCKPIYAQNRRIIIYPYNPVTSYNFQLTGQNNAQFPASPGIFAQRKTESDIPASNALLDVLRSTMLNAQEMSKNATHKLLLYQ
jgi:hypothetical protein